MRQLLSELRFAIRRLSREPGLLIGVVTTLALAIGASTAIFSFVNALLLRPFPFRDADRLVEIRTVRGGEQGKLSMAEIEDLSREAPSIEEISAHTGSAGGYNFSGEGRPEEWKAILTTGNLFHVLGLPLALGSPWPADMDRNRGYRVILTYGVWQSTFAGRDVTGQTITLDHAPGYVIHGVAPQGVDFPRGVQVFRSLGGFASYDRRDSRNVVGVARFRASAKLAQVRGELEAISRSLEERYPETNRGLRFEAYAFRDIYSGPARPYLLVLLAAAALLLLMGCLNVANLLLARALRREHDMAIRLALGAGRRQILTEAIAESLVLAILSAAAGVLLASWWVTALRSVIGERLPAWMPVTLDPRVLVFSAAIALVASMLAVLAPALHVAAKIAVAKRLREGGRGSSGSVRVGRLRDTLIAAQIAVAVILLVGAGALMQAFVALQNQDKGFDETAIATFRVALGWKRYGTADAIGRYYEQAQTSLAATPGIQAVAFGHAPPLTGQEASQNNVIAAEHQSAEEANRNPYVSLQAVSENYFDVLRIPIRSGRAFTPFDGPQSQAVAIVSHRLAERLWPGDLPIGRRIVINPNPRSAPSYRVIVGVAGDVQQHHLGGPASFDVYVPYWQSNEGNHYLLARTSLPPLEFQQHAERALWAIDAEQSLFDFALYQDRILAGVWQLGLSRLLLAIFGAVALILAGLGVYSLMSYVVAMQRRELAIRLALGAEPSAVRSLVLRRGAKVALAGIATGCAVAFGIGFALRGFLDRIATVDPWILLVVGGIVLACAIGATGLPAWRASRVDPVLALRGD
jgi:predicted permease